MIVFNNKPIQFNNKLFKTYIPYNPLNLPPYTIRLKYAEGTTPTFSKGTGVQISQSPNIWDLTYENSDWVNLLRGHDNLIEVLGANTSQVISTDSMFAGCVSVTNVALFDTSNVENMFQMFSYCNFTTVPLFDTSKVTDMRAMFNSCASLTTIPLLDTSSVTTMISMFRGCTSLTDVPLLDTSNVTDTRSMFMYCTSLTTTPLFDTSNVTRMEYMFDYCTSLTTIPLFNTSKVRNVNVMFLSCYNVESGALALYQQMSTQTTPPSDHEGTFTNCGRDTQTGAAELAQIPASWGGTGA